MSATRIELKTPQRGVLLLVHAPEGQSARYWWLALYRPKARGERYLFTGVCDEDKAPELVQISPGCLPWSLRFNGGTWLNLASEAEADRARAFLAQYLPAKEPA